MNSGIGQGSESESAFNLDQIITQSDKLERVFGGDVLVLVRTTVRFQKYAFFVVIENTSIDSRPTFCCVFDCPH